MKSKNSKLMIIGAVATVLFSSALTAQFSVSMNWKEFAGAVNDVPDGYGVVAANNWQNFQNVKISSDLTASDGSTSTVDFNVTGGYFDTFGFAPQDGTPMRAGLTLGAPGTPVEIALTGLSGTFTSYDVIVYLTGFVGNNASISDGTTTYFWQVPATYTSDLILTSDTSSGDGIDVGSYAIFSGLTADSTTLTWDSLSGITGIGGIQVSGTAVPEPGIMALVAGLASLVLIAVRRRRS